MSNTPTAKIADGRLILNLPDAETPALWVMDLQDAQTSVVRLEADRGGLFVLKKHGGKGVETVAVYRNRDAGTYAMDVAAKALQNARSVRAGAAPCSRAGRIFTYFVMVWFLLWSVGLIPLMMNALLTSVLSRPQVTASAQPKAAATPQTPAQAPATDSAGVPLSADDFLKDQSSTK